MAICYLPSAICYLPSAIGYGESVAMIECWNCHQQTDDTLPDCQHCGEPVRRQGLMSFLKSSRAMTPPAPPPSPASAAAPPEGKAPPREHRDHHAPKPGHQAPAVEPSKGTGPLGAPKPRTGPLAAMVTPDSVVVYREAERFFAVQVSGARSMLAQLFGSQLSLESLCSAMLFTAYAALVEDSFVRLKVAAVTPTAPLIFPIPAHWVKLILEPLSLYRGAPSSPEAMLMGRTQGRLTSEVTQTLIADLIDWPYLAMHGNKRASQAEPQTWDRHYADALTDTVRRNFLSVPVLDGDGDRTEARLKHFCQQHEQVATYLSHEISLIIGWIASQQDPQVRQRSALLAPQAKNPLDFSTGALTHQDYWDTLASYSHRQM
ncbi:MAG: hypothetical protein HYR71_11845 [Chloroflexi bacterium]|nr:hypothetical protein [Chloroflexota bacterium]